MTFKNEARDWISAAPRELHNAGLNGIHTSTGLPASAAMCIGLAQASAILALVEAQEAANEQARVANLIALDARGIVDAGLYENGKHEGQIFPYLNPRVAAVLGIGGDE